VGRAVGAGVKRVDAVSDGSQLAQMLAQRHNDYPTEQLSRIDFQDDPIPLHDGASTTFAELSVFGHRAQIESSHVAMQVWCGWLDSDVCEGALSRYLTFKNPQQVIIGHFSHNTDFNDDPFLTPAQHSPSEPIAEHQNRTIADFFDRFLRSDVSSPVESGIHYYTMGRVSGTTLRFGHRLDSSVLFISISRRITLSAQRRLWPAPQTTPIQSTSPRPPATIIAG
jgi:hypothetical protein